MLSTNIPCCGTCVTLGRHFSNGWRSHRVAFGNQVVDVPHIFFFLGDQGQETPVIFFERTLNQLHFGCWFNKTIWVRISCKQHSFKSYVLEIKEHYSFLVNSFEGFTFINFCVKQFYRRHILTNEQAQNILEIYSKLTFFLTLVWVITHTKVNYHHQGDAGAYKFYWSTFHLVIKF